MAAWDEGLLTKAKQGDDGALSALLKQFGPEIRREVGARIPRLMQADLDAHDVMQVTYLEVFTHIAKFQSAGKESFVAWLRRLALNNLRDAIRGIEADKRPGPSKRVRPAAGDSSTAGEDQLLGVTDGTPSACVRVGEAHELLHQAIDRLPADYRTVVRLCDLEGRSPAEVAAAMGRSTGAIYMLRGRAHEMLVHELPSASKLLESRS